MKLATDIGGTFTDLVYLDEASGELGTTKSSSTPPNFAQGILDTITKANLDAKAVAHFVHGTTVVINALTEHKGAKTALITTKGFRDVLAIARANRPDIYNLRFKKQPAFVPREYRYEVEERLDYKGEVLTPLNEADVAKIAAELKAEGIEAVAVAFLHSYANPVHEKYCAELLKKHLPDMFVTSSSDITKEWREYERSNTAVLNSYVQPVASSYVQNLENALRDMGVKSGLHIMKSNGGTNTFELSKQQPIHLVESGPVGGVIGAKAIGDLIGEKNIITMDVGGTTAKTSLIEDGVVKFTTNYYIEKDPFNPGYPIKVPVVDIVEIGAGGGSIAHIDDAGALKIGPQSAGAVPGPACYGQGGDKPTVTDANLVLQRINPDYFLGGQMQVDPELSKKAYTPIAESFDVSVEEAALGVVRLADANMVNAIKLVSVRRGYDPRDFALVAFGGGGAMHAASLAKELNIGKVIIPFATGTFSALGMLMTEPMQDFIRTKVLPGDENGLAQVRDILTEMNTEAADFMRAAGYPEAKFSFKPYIDMRYVGQEHTVRVPADELNLAKLESQFHDLHEQAYTFRLESPVQFVNYLVTITVSQDPVDLSRFKPKAGNNAKPKAQRQVYFEGGWQDTAIYERSDLPLGQKIAGPCIIEEPQTITVVHKGMQAWIDEIGNIVIDTGVGHER
ncbi:MAG: hydantoinase/oxoprolinase family protein [Trueperaceae bacterium]|nr:hydantoinase/oxoprolinase family protein [Trueperaceae bacterium]